MDVFFLIKSFCFAILCSFILILIEERKHLKYLIGGKIFTDAFPSALFCFLVILFSNIFAKYFIYDYIAHINAFFIISLIIFGMKKDLLYKKISISKGNKTLQSK